jgi:hypothetical protein
MQLRELKKWLNDTPEEYLDFVVGVGNYKKEIDGHSMGDVRPLEHLMIVPEDKTAFLVGDEERFKTQFIAMARKMNKEHNN